jgi:uncharacterized membrane protein YeaQ/YmgE (transglycosylase-associated protein family)
MSAILQLVIVGLIIGAIARFVLPGRDPIGFLGTLAVGVAGALLGWWGGRALAGAASVRAHPWLWGILGAIVVLLIVRSLSYRRGPRRWGRRYRVGRW